MTPTQVLVRCTLLAALGPALAGCAATASQSWRTASDVSAPVWNFRGTQSAFGNTVISINEQPVLQGKVSVWSGEGEMTGVYEGKAVVASCKKGKGSSVRTMCAITVEGRKASTLYFRVE